MGLLMLFIVSAAISSHASDQKWDKKYPRIVSLEGTVYDLSRQGARPLKKTDRILETFHPVTEPGARITIEINPELMVELSENSDLLLPSISWETRQLSELRLLKGRVQIEAQKKQKFLKIKSELFESEIPEGDFVFEFDRVQATASLMVIRGELSFGALNADEVVQLTAGQRVRFQAVKENDEFQYDLLLKGRKVPKGVLGKVEKVSPEILKRYSQEEKRKVEQIKRMKIEKAQVLAETQNQEEICHAPRGRLNQCVWRMEKNKCVRRRCTADGLWKDPQEVGTAACQRKSVATLCDY